MESVPIFGKNDEYRLFAFSEKIGYCETSVAERIKNAVSEPTYLMAPVKKNLDILTN